MASGISVTTGAANDEGFSALGCSITYARRHLSRKVKIPPACVAALCQWGDLMALTKGVSNTLCWKEDQLFVSWATPHKGKPLSHLSHWIVETISLAYRCKGLRAHSMSGVATSWALFRGVSVWDICAVATWATPHSFTGWISQSHLWHEECWRYMHQELCDGDCTAWHCLWLQEHAIQEWAVCPTVKY